MFQMTPSQARVVDAILTAVARGYEANLLGAADALFPTVNVPTRGGKIISFGRDAFLVVNSKRAPGASTKRVQTSYASESYYLDDYGLEALVPLEIGQEAANVPLELAGMHLQVVQQNQALERENEAATLARTLANYPTGNKDTLTGSNQWTHVDSNPFAAFEAAKEAIRKKTGRRPNVSVLGPTVLTALRTHPMVMGKISTSTDRVPATLAQLQALFEIERFVEGQAVSYSGTGSDFDDVWGKDAVLAYVSPANLASMGSQSFGYTYQLEGYPNVEQAYADRNRKSAVYPVNDARKAILVGNTAGFLFKNAAA